MLKYEADLKIALSKLKIIIHNLDKLKLEKDEIRDAVRKFLKMHELDDFETKDNNDQLWRLGIAISERRSINYDVLEKLLTKKQLDDVIVTTPAERLTTKPVKSYKKKNISNAPRAPRANVKKL